MHAAFEYALAEPEACSEWWRNSNFLVILSVPDEDALLELLDVLHYRKLPYKTVIEPDLGDEHTAVIVPPHPEASRYLSALPLALKGAAVAA